MVTRRKDNKGRVLKEGETQTKTGYQFRWRTKSKKRMSVFSTTLEGLRLKEEEILKEKALGVSVEANKNLTLNDFYNKWLVLKRGLKPNTFSNYRFMYETYVQNDFGKIKAKDIKRSDIKSFYNSLVDNLNLRVTTIDNVHTVVHQVLDIAVGDDCIPYNPSDRQLTELKIEQRKKDLENGRKKREGLTLEQEKILFDFLKNSKEFNRWYSVELFLYETGLRIGELEALQNSDINYEKNEVIINKTLTHYQKEDATGKKRTIYEVHSAKTESSIRTIPLSKKALYALELEKEYQRKNHVICQSEISGYKDFVFLNRFGLVYKDNTVNRALVRIVEECNKELGYVALPRISNHISRHTLSTRLNEAGVNAKAIQKILGHSDINITLNVYTDAKEDFLKDSVGIYERFSNEKFA